MVVGDGVVRRLLLRGTREAVDGRWRWLEASLTRSRRGRRTQMVFGDGARRWFSER
jgi:hypothetical protein